MTAYDPRCEDCWRCDECGHPVCDTDPGDACRHGQRLCETHRSLCALCVLDDEELAGVAPVMCPTCEGTGMETLYAICGRCGGEGAVEPHTDDDLLGRWSA